MPRTYGCHDGKPSHGVEAGADHTAMDPVVRIVANQLIRHHDASRDSFGRQQSNLQAQHLVKSNLFFKQGFQPVDEFGLKFSVLGGTG